MKRRGSGILLHLASLPSPFGIGDMGPGAYRFADFLAETGQGFWQILPLNPTDPAYYSSPYHSGSAFASNPLFISPELLAQDGLLTPDDLASLPVFPGGRIDYPSVIEFKERLFHRAYERFKPRERDPDYERFTSRNSYWLDDFALFVALKSHFQGRSWLEWPEGFRERHPEAMDWARQEFRERIGRERFLQFLFFQQWTTLREYCNRKGIQIIGDIPIYVIHDSVDVWTHPEFFKLDQEKRPAVVAGVPPDYFSETGQLWGNPVYRWDALKTTGYEWWTQRIAHNLALFDFMRIDHFRGFVAFWEVPATEKTAVRGKWVKAPAVDFFSHLTKRFSHLPILAEDLGIITPSVREVMARFDLPGMKVLLFAFGPDLPANPYIPHHYPRNCVAYTGTHDNNTIRGWFEKEASPDDKKRLFAYLGREVPAEELPWEMIRLLMLSVANAVIFPMQDLLGLGEEARMNRPSTREGNWQWRLLPEPWTPDLAAKLRELTEISGRV